MRVTLPCVCFLILFLNCSFYAQKDRQSWKAEFEQGSFYFLEKELDSTIHTNHPEKHEALKSLGDLYKVRGDIETAYFYWKQSDSILKTIDPGLNSRSIELAHLSNFYYEKFNPELTKFYNDSLVNVISKLGDLPIEDCWIWNVIAQSNKLALDKDNGPILSKALEEKVFPYYLKGIEIYESDERFLFDLARTFHLYANAYVDLVHAFSFNMRESQVVSKLEQKANKLYDKAIAIYKPLYGNNHYEIARTGYVKALLYQYAHPKPDPNEFNKTIKLFEYALSVFNISEVANVLNISEALGCAKQYHRALYQEYRLTSNLELKRKQDSIFNLSKKLWKDGLHLFKTKNSNQLISLYGLSPFSERIYQLYYECQVLNIVDMNEVFTCMQMLRYRDIIHWNETGDFSIKNIKDIQHTLKENQCYLDFSVLPKPLLFMITKDDIKSVELTVKNLDVNLLQDAINSKDFNQFVNASSCLSQLLIKEIDISTFDDVYITASGWFTHIPFQALLYSKKNIKGNDFRELDYLIHHTDIHYLFNTSDFKFDTLMHPWNVDVYLPEYIGSKALPFAERFTEEFKFVAKILKGNNAKSSSFTSSPSSILHYSGHGIGSFLKRESAQLTFYDKSINVSDIYASNICADLVVLNACSSGVGVFTQGDGVDGFSRAFYMKGVKQIMSSFWDLDDRASHQIMKQFYENLARGKKSNQSLRESQITYISEAKNSDLAAPYYWAGHQLYGMSQSFEKQIKSEEENRAYLWYCIPLLVALILYISFRIRPAKS